MAISRMQTGGAEPTIPMCADLDLNAIARCLPVLGVRVRIPTAAPVGLPTSHVFCAVGAVNRRFPGVSPCRLEGRRTRRPAVPSPQGYSLSEARDLGDLVYKLQATEIAINLRRGTLTSCTSRPATGRVWDRKTALSTHGIATRRGPVNRAFTPSAPAPKTRARWSAVSGLMQRDGALLECWRADR